VLLLHVRLRRSILDTVSSLRLWSAALGLGWGGSGEREQSLLEYITLFLRCYCYDYGMPCCLLSLFLLLLRWSRS